jgi:hypothetical protein
VTRAGFVVLFVAIPALWFTTGSNAAAPGGSSNTASLTTPTQILAATKKAVDAATSVHLVATGTSSGSPIAFNLKLVAGRGGEGTVTENGLTFQIVRIGTKAYFEAGTAFWKKFAGSVGPQLFDGKWIEASATSGQLASLTPFTSLRAFISSVLDTHGTLKVGKSATIDGRPAIALTDTTKGGTLYVAATGKPYPLEITPSKGAGTVKFESWDQPFSLTAPKNPLNFTNQLKG